MNRLVCFGGFCLAALGCSSDGEKSESSNSPSGTGGSTGAPPGMATGGTGAVATGGAGVASGGSIDSPGGTGGLSSGGTGGTEPELPPEPVFEDPFGPDAEWNLVQTDMGNTEGPTFVPEENGFIFFNEGRAVVDNRHDLWLWRIGEDDHTHWFTLPREMQNHGNIYHQGIVYGANRLPGEIGRIKVSDLSYDAMPFNATGEFDGEVLDLANDLDRYSDGSIYFSEWSGRQPRDNHVGIGIYRLHTDGELERLASGGSPNGIAFSADCRVFYSTNDGDVYRREVSDGGTLSEPRLIVEEGGANGLAVDSQGNLYVSHSSGILVYNSSDEYVLTFGDMRSVNFAFGGDDHKLLFVTTNNGYGWVRTRVRGAECNGLGAAD